MISEAVRLWVGSNIMSSLWELSQNKMIDYKEGSRV